MKYFSEFRHDIPAEQLQDVLKHLKGMIQDGNDADLLKRIFGLLDLTSLSEKDNAATIGRLCEQVNLLDENYPEMPPPAAICVYPELVMTTRAKLNNPLVNIASVGGGFPSSQTFLEVKLKEIAMAIDHGAEEIDIVMNVGKFHLGLYEEIFEEISLIKERMGNKHLKVILETGSLDNLSMVWKASLLTMDAGADFIKTSTGKAGSGAEIESFTVMCLAIKEFYHKTGKKVGIKPAGGISTIEKAIEFYQIVAYVLGEEWKNSEKFRIGASRLADSIIQNIYQKEVNFRYFN